MPQRVECSCPAKINLFLAVTGRRPDGFHDLVSLVAQLDLEDRLTAELRSGEGPDTLECAAPDLPSGPDNLVLKAAAGFREIVKDLPPVHFVLEKRIPSGAGLGGGSSDAAGALRLMNHLAGDRLALPELKEIAARVGSDCALFLYDGPVVMRGRGESVTPVNEQAAQVLKGRTLLLIKPHFGIRTDWAYRTLAENEIYDPVAEAEERIRSWEAAPSPALPLSNTFERAIFPKYLFYPTLAEQLAAQSLREPTLSGSGSSCFVLLEDALPRSLQDRVSEYCGKGSMVLQASIN